MSVGEFRSYTCLSSLRSFVIFLNGYKPGKEAPYHLRSRSSRSMRQERVGDAYVSALAWNFGLVMLNSFSPTLEDDPFLLTMDVLEKVP